MTKEFSGPVVVALLLTSCALSALSEDNTETSIIRSSQASRIIPPPSTYIFPADKYVYLVEWHHLHAGTSTIKIERSGELERVTATADSAGMPDKIYKVHDNFAADIDARTYCTLHITKHNEEGPHRRDITIAFDYPHEKGYVDAKDLKTAQSVHQDFPIPPCVTDVISGFFYAASLPLAPGYSTSFPVNENGKTSEILLQVEAREKVKVRAGEFPTLRAKVEPVAGPMKGKGTLTIWFSDDARKIPVEIQSKLGFANLLFALEGVEPSPRKVAGGL